jgi:hypothetical protein
MKILINDKQQEKIKFVFLNSPEHSETSEQQISKYKFSFYLLFIVD